MHLIRKTVHSFPERLDERYDEAGRRVVGRIPNHPTRPARPFEDGAWWEPVNPEDVRTGEIVEVSVSDRRIKFLRDHDGFSAGQIAIVTSGIADAYVAWAQAAEYVDDIPSIPNIALTSEHPTKSFAPPRDKMMKPESIRRK